MTTVSIAEGLADEVRGLLQMGFSERLKSMQSLGYRHIIDHLSGRQKWEETLRTFKRDTRRYAKRQLTWFRSDPDMQWLEPGEIDRASRRIESFLGW